MDELGLGKMEQHLAQAAAGLPVYIKWLPLVVGKIVILLAWLIKRTFNMELKMSEEYVKKNDLKELMADFHKHISDSKNDIKEYIDLKVGK